MCTKKRKPLIITLSVLLFSLASLAVSHADIPRQEEPPPPELEELKKLVSENLPKALTQNNQELVRKLISPQLGPPLVETFDPELVVKSLFGRGGAVFMPGCNQTTTPVGDRDPGECKAVQGKAAGKGAYKALRYSKHLAFGNAAYLSRTADVEVDPAKIVPVQMKDEVAYAKARELLTKVFGVTEKELPLPPEGAQLPVNTVMLGYKEENMKSPVTIPVEKRVSLQRGLWVDAGEGLEWVPGPGRAYVLMDDKEVKEVAVRGWQQVMPDPNVKPEMAKTRDDLVNEIAEDLLTVNDGPIRTMNFRIVLAANPSEKGASLLLPAVQVRVSPVPRELPERDQASVLTSAAYIREYHLAATDEMKEEQE